jgi:hypothetical protein
VFSKISEIVNVEAAAIKTLRQSAPFEFAIDLHIRKIGSAKFKIFRSQCGIGSGLSARVTFPAIGGTHRERGNFRS